MTLRVNGRDHFIDPAKHRSLIEALRDLGYDIPHFCYHPGLSLDGNCRMCCVNVVDLKTGTPVQTMDLSRTPPAPYPKPVISCREPLDPRGMSVLTETPAVLEARLWTMEFLLINHPLDCPVCDKAGECLLQDHSYVHGPATGRFAERKNEKPPKEVGPSIMLWTDRCILCRRCTRFLQEVSGTGELCIVERGDRCEIAAAPGRPVDNELMGNIVDLCPVGALIHKELKYSYRAWYLRRVDTICPCCARGCNIQAQAQGQYVRRLVPRENREVNGWWMCDRGRLDFRHVNSPERLQVGRVDGRAQPPAEAAREAGRRLAAAAREAPEAVAVLASAWLTLEELHVLKRLCIETLRCPLPGLLAQADWTAREFPGFRIEADRNPNRAGARLILGADAEARAARILESARAHKLKALYLVLSMPHFAPTAELREALAGLPDGGPGAPLTIVQDLFESELSRAAGILLPGASFAEKDGAYVSSTGRVQLLRRVIDPLANGEDDLALIQCLAQGAGVAEAPSPARQVFSRLTMEHSSLAGMDYRGLGRKGLILR
jgi:NADH-quinone oxidoreductase subunit G